MSWGQLFRISILVILGLVVLLIGIRACYGVAPPVEPEILNSLPVEWSVITATSATSVLSFTPPTPWREVNIDGDPDIEYLLLYAYDNSSNDPESEAADGPVGGLIYDLQDTSEFVTGQPARPIPLQPSGFYVPYRLLPSYWHGLDGAFIGAPGSGPNVQMYEIPRTPPTVGESITGSGQGNTELVLTANDNTLTFVWWRNLFDGYGATQLIGTAGFREINGEWNSLADWAQSSTVIKKIDALFPIYGELGLAGVRTTIDYADIGRSLLCRVTQYQREDTEFYSSPVAGPVYQTDIEYIARERGIQFCRQAPAHPFYPEGMIVKYLLAKPDSRDELLWDGLTEAQTARILNTTTFDAESEWIENVETRANIDYPESFRTTHPPSLVETRRLPTQVCVEIQKVASDDSGRRLLYFSLLNTPPTVDENASQPEADAVSVRVSDRLWITDLVDATDWRVDSCAELVALDAQRELESSN